MRCLELEDASRPEALLRKSPHGYAHPQPSLRKRHDQHRRRQFAFRVKHNAVRLEKRIQIRPGAGPLFRAHDRELGNLIRREHGAFQMAKCVTRDKRILNRLFFYYLEIIDIYNF